MCKLVGIFLRLAPWRAGAGSDPVGILNSGRLSTKKALTVMAGLTLSACVMQSPQLPPLEVQPRASPYQAAQARVSEAYGKLPLSFELNQGQTDEQVKFLSRGRGYSLFLTSTEAVLVLRQGTRRSSDLLREADEDTTGDRNKRLQTVVRMKLEGANPAPKAVGLDELPGKSNYFIGNDPKRWQRDVSNYARVKYSSVYPGIDLVYYGNQRQLEYDFVVAPGADPKRIKLAFEGVEKLALDSEGNLVLTTPQSNIVQYKPVIYQHLDGARKPVDGRYVLLAKHRVGFQLAGYDTTQPLIIDPVLAYSTYLGGNGNDVGNAIAVDSAGNAYVTGSTSSTNFPGASGSLIQPTWLGSVDVFVTKLNAAGSALVYSTYLGGSGGDTGYAIAVDSAGNAYVTGATDSPTVAGPGNIPFPTVGAFQASYHLGGDAFITKLNAAGSALVYSTYLGGSGAERGYGIAVDSSFNAYVTGHTNSVQGIVPSPTDFPTAAPFQAQNGSLGNYDAFVTKINAAGSALVYSTYLGGNASEYSLDGGAIAVDSDGNAYVGGTTASTNFPGVSPSSIQPTIGGRSDGFVVKFNAAGSALLYSTYLGGTTDDAVNGIAIDAARNAYVVGYTDSPNFPTASPLQASRNGPGNDAFVSKLNAAGSALVYSTYLGGTGAGDIAYAVAVDAGGNAYVSGSTNSSNFPTVEPIQAVNAGGGDAFISKLNAAGSALVYSTYLGGSTGDEHGYGIALDTAGNAYVTGQTNSTDFPTVMPFQPARGGVIDVFVTKILMQFTLTVTKQGTGTGTVASNPAGINCGADCTEAYNAGTAVTLTAAPAAGSFFAGWSGGTCTGAGDCIFNITANTTVTATFTRPTLTVTRAGTGIGTVTSNPAGIDCGADCSEIYNSGTIVTLTGTPAAGSFFAGWSGGTCTGAGDCIFNITADTTVTATFDPQPAGTFTLTVTKGGSGDGMVTGTGIKCGMTCSASFNSGTSVTLTATPASGSFFAGWSGGCSGTGTCTVTMTANASVTAKFSKTFTDDPLTAQVTLVKAVHINDLRQAIGTLRSQRALTTFAYTDPTLIAGVTEVRAAHITELRTALNGVYTALGRALPTYTDPTITAGVTVIKSAHIAEIRSAVRAAE